MWTSVPQIVVVVMRMSASSGPTSGIGFSSRTMRPGSTKMAAFILGIVISPRLVAAKHSTGIRYHEDAEYLVEPIDEG